MPSRRTTPLLLILSLCILIPMIPGGPIENRTFPDMPLLVAVSYNVLIIVVGLGTVPLAALIARGRRLALLGAAADGLAFAAIYGLDLARVFPGGPPLSPLLIAFETAGLLTGLAMAISAVIVFRREPAHSIAQDAALSPRLVAGFVVAALAAGGFALYYGTVHALH